MTEYIADYDGIIKGDLKHDILLRPGDRIIVPWTPLGIEYNLEDLHERGGGFQYSANTE